MKILLFFIVSYLLIENCVTVNAKCSEKCAAVRCKSIDYCGIDETLIPANCDTVCCAYCEKSKANLIFGIFVLIYFVAILEKCGSLCATVRCAQPICNPETETYVPGDGDCNCCGSCESL